MKLMKLSMGIIACAVLSTLDAHATLISAGFGNIPDAPANAFGGSGIPQDAAVWGQFTGIQGDVLTLAGGSTQYKSNPALGNDGVSTFFAAVGLGNDGVRSPWNYDNYFASQNGVLSAYHFSLNILNVGNGQSFTYNTGAIPDNVGLIGFYEGNSGSLDFSSLKLALGYDPNTPDDYITTLSATFGDSSIGSISWDTKTGSGAGGTHVPEGGSTATMLGAGFFGLACIGGVRRKLVLQPTK
jgi:hypothetical protein